MSVNYDFWQDRSDKRVRGCEFNNFVLSQNNFIISGCEVSADGTDMYVDVSSGRIFINGRELTYSGGSILLSNSDVTYERCDLIALDNNGVLVKIDGTPANPPVTPDYSPEDYIVLAFVIVDNGVTIIESTDVFNIGFTNDAYYNTGVNSKIINGLMSGNHIPISEDDDRNIIVSKYIDDEGTVLATNTLTYASFKNLDDFIDYTINSWSDGGDDATIGTIVSDFSDGDDVTSLSIVNSSGTASMSTTHDFTDLSAWIGSTCNTGYVNVIVKSNNISSITNIELRIGSSSGNYRSVTLNSSSVFWMKNSSYYTGLRFDLSAGSSTGSPDGTNVEYVALIITETDDSIFNLRELNICKDGSSITSESFRDCRREVYTIESDSKNINKDYFYDSQETIRDKNINGGY